ncbi:YhcN/YlaJ family sporulation lipoprotein [Bacillus sp. JJ1764]|uniref:YhcN/YlaJ family sporulation lipoprotein n=1 Tax=Bacillus sp. JJ1764 TaxID=3122964 RepID=UPI002FFEA669
MKKLAIIIGLCSMTALSACSRDSAHQDVYEESGNTINVNNKRHELYREGGANGVRNVSNDYGFVRHQKSPIMNDNNSNTSYAAMDREQVAHVISSLSTSIPHVNDVATLVTDQEVLIAYRTNSKNRHLTADQVKKTGMSVVPRYYHVYVTDNKHLLRDVENLASLDSTGKNSRDQVNYVISQMKKSPQGARMNKSEDENGLTPDDYKTNNVPK